MPKKALLLTLCLLLIIFFLFFLWTPSASQTKAENIWTAYSDRYKLHEPGFIEGYYTDVFDDKYKDENIIMGDYIGDCSIFVFQDKNDESNRLLKIKSYKRSSAEDLWKKQVVIINKGEIIQDKRYAQSCDGG